jgi:hypothetical protein
MTIVSESQRTHPQSAMLNRIRWQEHSSPHHWARPRDAG